VHLISRTYENIVTKPENHEIYQNLFTLIKSQLFSFTENICLIFTLSYSVDIVIYVLLISSNSNLVLKQKRKGKNTFKKKLHKSKQVDGYSIDTQK